MKIMGCKMLDRIALALPDGTPIVIQVVRVLRDKVLLGIEAPREISVDREEIRDGRVILKAREAIPPYHDGTDGPGND